MEVDWKYGVGAGSMWLTFANTGETFWKRLVASGTGIQVTRPYCLPESTTGSVADVSHVPFITADHLVLNTGSMLSGATAVEVNIRYR